MRSMEIIPIFRLYCFFVTEKYKTKIKNYTFPNE